MHMEPALAVLAFHHITETGRYSSICPDKFVAYDFHTGAVRGYLAKRLAAVKWQKNGDGLVVPVLAPVANVNWLPNVARKTISDIQCGYRRYHSNIVVNGCFLTEFQAEFADELDDTFAQKALWETGDGFSFSANDTLVMATALQWLSKITSSSGAKLADLIRNLFDDIGPSWVAAIGPEKKVERQKEFVYIANKSTSDALNDVAALRRRITASDSQETELFTDASKGSSFK